jgi:hypothetical protein
MLTCASGAGISREEATLASEEVGSASLSEEVGPTYRHARFAPR